jgi:hypothetical protein
MFICIYNDDQLLEGGIGAVPEMSHNATLLDNATGWGKHIPNPCLCCGLMGLVRTQVDIILYLCLMHGTFESLHIPQQCRVNAVLCSLYRCE